MQVLSSLSGITFYAPSAGFAPTNSADVSAIASSYQVVSATATQLYAGTAYVTSVNDNPLSASRAGNAANASMANSAYYDGTGRLISALPDSATVSAIASSYAESAASSKLDATASSQFLTAVPDGYATTAYVDSSISGFAYESAVSAWTAKQDALTFDYDDNKISAINGSALAGQGGATGDYVEKSAREVAIGTGNTSVSTALAQGYKNSAMYYSFAQGSHNTVSGVSFAQGVYNSASSVSFAQGNMNGATGSSFAQGYLNTAKGVSFAQGYHNSAINTAAVFGQYNLRGNGDTATGDSAAFAIGDGTAYNARHDLMLVTKDGEITMYSSTADTVGTGIISSIRAISAAATGGVNSATVSAIASSYAESAVSSVSSNYYTTANESGYALSSDVSATVDLVGTQSANWGGSALALSAGPGVKLEKSGNVLVASTDETVLWENYTFASNRSDSVVMSEDPFNFSYVQITFEMETTTETWSTVQTQIVDMVALSSCVNKDFTLNGTCVNGSVIYARCSRCHFNGTAINDIASVQWYNGNVGTMAGPLHIYRIVGIDRIAGV